MRRNPTRESRIRLVLFHPALWFVAASVGTILLATNLWTQYRAEITKNSDFVLTAEKVHLLTPEPEWARAPLMDVILKPDSEPSLLEPSLLKTTTMNLQSVGWIKSINSIKKSASGLQIELEYRHPVALVFFPDYPKTIPVDGDSRLFDMDALHPTATEQLPRIRVYQPAGKDLVTWQTWPDERIKDCVKLADFLGESWDSLGFYQIVTKQSPVPNAIEKPLELYSKYGAIVIWGSAPGNERNGEASAETKFKILAQHILKNGSFEKSNPNHQFDLRSGRLVKSRSPKTAQGINFFEVK